MCHGMSDDTGNAGRWSLLFPLNWMAFLGLCSPVLSHDPVLWCVIDYIFGSIHLLPLPSNPSHSCLAPPLKPLPFFYCPSPSSSVKMENSRTSETLAQKPLKKKIICKILVTWNCHSTMLYQKTIARPGVFGDISLHASKIWSVL